MGIPYFLAAFIIFLLFLFFRRRYLKAKQQERDDAFWENETKASTTVRPAPSDGEYTVIPLSTFAFGLSSDGDIAALESKIHALEGEKLMNLTGMSNADVKLKYGANHFDSVCRAGEKYDELVSLLAAYGGAIGEAGFSKEAVEILEYLIRSGCDLKSAWISLGKLYAAKGEYEKLISLIGRIDASPLAIKNATREQLKGMLPKANPDNSEGDSSPETVYSVITGDSQPVHAGNSAEDITISGI